jgi:hypothetical protein
MPETGPEFVQGGLESGTPVWRMWWTELTATLLLGLAAVGAGWSAYQSASWSRAQTFSLYRVADARFRASMLQNRAYLLRITDIESFTAYAQAVSQNDVTGANFIFQRFRPVMKAAVTAWLATRPLQNPAAPSNPLSMKEYRLTEEDESQRINKQADQVFHEAQLASGISDRYVPMVVVFALVTLFCGFSPKFWSPGMRMAINAMALCVFVAALVVLTGLPRR